MTRGEAEEMLAILSAQFGIPTPALKWSERTVNGRASWKDNAIACGHLAWRGVTNSLLHEFAHILTFRRYGKHKVHGKQFTDTLIEVAHAWLGDATKYDWSTEYVSVKANGPQRRKP